MNLYFRVAFRERCYSHHHPLFPKITREWERGEMVKFVDVIHHDKKVIYVVMNERGKVGAFNPAALHAVSLQQYQDAQSVRLQTTTGQTYECEITDGSLTVGCHKFTNHHDNRVAVIKLVRRIGELWDIDVFKIPY